VHPTTAKTLDTINRAGEAIRLNSGLTVFELGYVVEEAETVASILVLMGFVRLDGKRLRWID
jgi:hypothetical protein